MYSEDCVDCRLVLGKPTASPLMSVQSIVVGILQKEKVVVKIVTSEYMIGHLLIYN